MDWPRSVYVAGVAGMAVGFGGALVYSKSGTSTGGESNLLRLSSALEGLTRQLDTMQASLSGIEKVLRERELPGREAEDCTDGTTLQVRVDSRLRSMTSGSQYSLASNMQSDAFDTAEEDHRDTSSDEEDPDSLESFLDRVDALHAKKDKMSETQNEIFLLLTARTAQSADEGHLLWRFARVHKALSDLAKAEGNVEEQKRLVYAGIEHAQHALDVAEDMWQAHQWYAILLGLSGTFESTDVKIKNGKVFKEHVDRAIALNSSDYSLHHLLAQWSYAVASLTWIERQAATLLYGEPPRATFDEALANFMAAERLYTGKWKNNKLMVAKCYYAQSNYTACKQWLEEAKVTPVVSEEDRTSQTEIEALLLKC